LVVSKMGRSPPCLLSPNRSIRQEDNTAMRSHQERIKPFRLATFSTQRFLLPPALARRLREQLSQLIEFLSGFAMLSLRRQSLVVGHQLLSLLQEPVHFGRTSLRGWLSGRRRLRRGLSLTLCRLLGGRGLSRRQSREQERKRFVKSLRRL